MSSALFHPNPLFDGQYYLAHNPDVAATGQDPLVHFIEFGCEEGRKPSSLFDPAYYSQQNPDVAPHDALAHFMEYGAKEGRKPHPLFDTAYYLSENEDVARSGSNPLIHFLLNGATEGRRPNPFFDPQHYLESNPDVADDGINPLVHFLEFGASEGRSPDPNFDLRRYLEDYPDVAASGQNPLEHYLETGQREGRTIAAIAGAANGEPGQRSDSNDYLRLKASIREQRDLRMKSRKIAKPPMIDLATSDLELAARDLMFGTDANPSVSIVIPVYNQLRLTIECLLSISRFTTDVPYEVIVVDDGSSDDIAGTLEKINGIRYIRNPRNLGFLLSSHAGAEAARGQFIVFLNNDAQVTEGWLAPLINTFDALPDVGIVSPKLIFPNGMLQEAGAFMRRDASSELIGVFDAPELPVYNCMREVIYVSGACMVLRTETYRAVGGFDRRYIPAYCEDSDLCFQVRERGLRVIYNPASTVIHHLSITSNAVDPAYKQRRVTENQQKFAEKWQAQIDALQQVRAICFYLPQFHPVPENDLWWGKGFTEWTNVSKAAPNFVGHYQPRLPADQGFYDLRVAEVLEQQAALARRYGVHGFCFFYYWFNGRRILEMPIERMLASGQPDFPFCLSWANENWTRRWDGMERDVLLEQKHGDDDDVAVILDLMRYMRDPRYIRIDGRPLLLIYRINLFPDIRRSVGIWRDICRREGLGEIYLAFVESFEHATAFEDPKTYGFDASVEYPPHGMSSPVPMPGKLLNREFQGSINDYPGLVRRYLARDATGYTRFRGVMPSWDNTARRQNHATIYHGATPGAYQAWLETALDDTLRSNFGDERVVFINAWNEWAEGAHLEPDRRFGHGFLEATRNAQDGWLLR